MAIKRYVEGQGWVEIANNSSSFGKATNISISDKDDLFDSSNVEGALSEIAYDIKQIKRDLVDHETNHPSGGDGPGSGPGTGVLPTITSEFEIITSNGEDPIEIPIFFTSPNLGDGTCYILVRNIEVAMQQVSQGMNTIKVPPIGAGTKINVSIYVKDRAGMMSNQLTWYITAGGISMSIRTETNSDFAYGARVAIAYNISCISTETIYAHFCFRGKDHMTGEQVEKQVDLVSKNGYNSLLINDGDFTLGIGVYTVEYWADSGDYSTEHKTFTFVLVDENTLLISTDFDSSKDCYEGLPISIPYRVSINRPNTYFNVDLYIDGQLTKSLSTKPAFMYWSISSLNIGAHEMKIHAYNESLGLDNELIFTCNVVQGEYSRIMPIDDASLLCWFDATEMTNDDANRDVWIDKICGNRARLYNFNYGNNGWLQSGNGSYSELVMTGTAYVEIDMTPFKNNFRDGATIELFCKTRDVGNDAARVLDATGVLAPFKGVYIDAREAYLNTDSQSIHAAMGEDEWIHVMYVIDRESKYAHVCINGVINKSCKLNDVGTGTSAILESIDHDQKIYLNSQKGTDLFGSCEVKHFRVYDRALTYEEMLQNYLSTFEDLTIQKEKADFNDASKMIMPMMYITADPAELDLMTNEHRVEVSMTYYSPNSELYGETLTTATNCLMYWQGTSSIGYNIKNYNLILRDSNRQEINYSPYPNCIPQSLFCLKANYMESTNAHNVGLAEFVRKYLYTKNNPAQDEDPKASRTVQGFPILLYINNEFVGLYDFNLDRFSTKAFGYETEKYKNTCRVYEISANTNTTAGAFCAWTPDTGVDEWTWYDNDFTGIYPTEIQNPMNDDFSALKELVNFVANSNDEVFITNFDTYFDKESVIRYYIMVMVFGLVDSLGKNAKLVTYDGIKWYFEFYDMDTAIGLNNSGGVEYDVDIEVTIDKFNTSDSKLWTRVKQFFMNDIINEYHALRSSTFTEEKIFECLFDNQIHKIPELQYNLSTKAKYLDPGLDLAMSNGNRYYGIKRWITERLLFCDTLFNFSSTTADFVTVRSMGLGDIYLELQTYSPMYVKIRWKKDDTGKFDTLTKIERNKSVRCYCPYYMDHMDQEILIYGAPYLKDIGDLTMFKPKYLLMDGAKRLTKINCPDDPELSRLTLMGCTYLQHINVSNCPKLGTEQNNEDLKLQDCANLRYLDASGTSLTGVSTSTNGGNLVELYVPSTLKTLSLYKQYSLKTIGIPGPSNLENSTISNMVKNASNIAEFKLVDCPLVERLVYKEDFSASGAFFDGYNNERRANELGNTTFKYGEWKTMMNWSVGLGNCHTFYIDNSCHNVPAMSFRNMGILQKLSLLRMPNLKSLLLGANCCGYKSTSPVYKEFDWENDLYIEDCPNIEEFRLHEMYPYNYSDDKKGNLTYFTFKPGTGSIKLSDKFPNLKLFGCNLITQNIHQIILPPNLETLIINAWHQNFESNTKNNGAREELYNVDSIFFEGMHDESYIGIDLSDRPMRDVRITAPYATSIIGLNTVNEYVNPIFNELKSNSTPTKPIVVPYGKIDLSQFKWRAVSDWFAYMDFTNTPCQITYPSDWDAFLNNITKADRMFYYCTNPDITWEFAMRFFPKVSNMTGLTTMYQHATLAEQQDFETDGVELNNANNVTGYTSGNHPFIGTNLKYIKSVNLTGAHSWCYAFASSNLVKVGDLVFSGSLTTDGMNTMGLNSLFANSIYLQEVGNITCTSAKTGSSGTYLLPANSTFSGCAQLQKVGTLDVAVGSLESFYFGCVNLKSENITLPDTTHATSISSLFRNCQALTEVTLDNIENVILADSVFAGCDKLTTVNLPSITEDSVIQDMQSMFSNCKKLTSINLGGSLPAELRNMNNMFTHCEALQQLPELPSNFNNDATMKSCLSYCHALTNDAIYKVIPSRVVDVTELLANSSGITNPKIDVQSVHVIAKQMFRRCKNMESFDLTFSGTTLRDSVKLAEECIKLKSAKITFPKALVMDTNYSTGVTYYQMFSKCTSLENVEFNMAQLIESNTKADFGAMFEGTQYLKSIKGLDFRCLKKTSRSWSSTYGTYDSHDTSITAGATFHDLVVFEPTGLLSSDYDFKNLASLDHTITILNHLDTVTTKTTLGLVYNLNDVIDNPDMEGVDERLLTAAIAAKEKGWSFAQVS